MSASATQPADVRCPRCGYDQRGVATAWRESCPMEGTCAECGHCFRWAELLMPRKFQPPWCVEFATPARRLPAAIVGTLGRSCLPWRFFSTLKMSHAVRPRRLVLYLAALLVLPVALYVIEQTTVAVLLRVELNADPRFTVNQTYTRAVLEAIVAPLSKTSSGTLSTPWSTAAPYFPPSRIHEQLANRQFGGPIRARRGVRAYGDFRDALVGSFRGWLLGLSVALLVPIGFVMLPISRRRARVRWGHIVRVTVYGLFVPVLLASVFLAAVIVAYAVPAIRGEALEGAVSANRWVAVPFLLVWWTCAVGRYLKIPHAAGVGSLMVLAGFLVALVIAWVVMPEATVNVIELFVPSRFLFP